MFNDNAYIAAVRVFMVETQIDSVALHSLIAWLKSKSTIDVEGTLNLCYRTVLSELFTSTRWTLFPQLFLPSPSSTLSEALPQSAVFVALDNLPGHDTS